MNRRSVLLSAAAIATTGALGAATIPQPAHAKMPPGLIGTWRISDEIGRPVGETGLMRIDPNGRIIIALSGRLADGATPASISPDEAARLYRGTLVMAGTFQAAPSAADGNGVTKVDVAIEEANVPGMINTRFQLGFKVHDNERISTGTGEGAPFQLDRIWWRL